MKLMSYDQYRAQGGTKSPEEYKEQSQNRIEAFAARSRGETGSPRFAGNSNLQPVMETLDRGMNDRSGDTNVGITPINDTMNVGADDPINDTFNITPEKTIRGGVTYDYPVKDMTEERLAQSKPPAPLTGTTEEGVMANFQPDPKRDLAKNLLDQTVAGVEPDTGSTAAPTMDQQRDAGVQQLETKAAAAPSSGQMASTVNTVGSQPSVESVQPSSSEVGATSNIPSYDQFAKDFMKAFTNIPAEKPQVNTEATFPEYMSQYSPKTAGDFGNMGASYSQDNEYSNYQDYNSPGQYQAEQMQGSGPYDIENFMSSQSVPQQQNNFSQAGNFFSDAYGQMEQAATQETTADKRRNRFSAAGSAAKRFS